MSKVPQTPSSKLPWPPVAERIWDMKYRLKASGGVPIDETLQDTLQRVARAVASAEPPDQRDKWQQRFDEALANFEFLPAGRILAGAGSGRAVTLFNCFVMGTIGDNLPSIFDNVKEAALTMQQGGGIGHDFSTLRPAGAPVKSIGAEASGPVSFMDVWDSMCRTIMSAGQRRGAMMATLRCDHPDIERFIDAKADAARLRNFNLSVLVTDAFVDAIRRDMDWPLSFEGTVYRTVRARALWDRIMRATYDYAEPGVIFIDRVNAANNLAYCETISATNPCGEQPLPPHGACLLGSVNLARIVTHPFTPQASLDTARLAELAGTAVRFLDDCIDISEVALDAQRHEARQKRRIGLGITGLADALIMCGLHYGSTEAVAMAEKWASLLQESAYTASAMIAAEKGAFPLFSAEPFLASPNVAQLPESIRRDIARHGIRNGCLTSIAPTGTISLLASNVSSGIEPVFDFQYRRRMLMADGSAREETVEDFAHAVFRRIHGEAAALPDTFVTAGALPATAHLQMQQAVQTHVDSSISKTINCPEDLPFDDFKSIYMEAYDRGLKGCTTFRPNDVTGSVLSAIKPSVAPKSEAAGAFELDGGGAAGMPLPAPARVDSASSPRFGIVYMARPLERDAALSGATYKLRWPASDHALYVTINDIERDGRRRPFEIFINTKNLEHFAWTVALTRMISAVFRRGGDVSFVVDELKAIFDPQGGQWIDGRYVPSLLAAIGGVIETHMLSTGFLQKPLSHGVAGEGVEMAGRYREGSESGQAARAVSGSAPAIQPVAITTVRPARHCPRCFSDGITLVGGCWVCHDCGYSKCG